VLLLAGLSAGLFVVFWRRTNKTPFLNAAASVPVAVATADPIHAHFPQSQDFSSTTNPLQSMQQESRWRLCKDETDEWYVNAASGEVQWTMPPGGVLVE
jgi:hypothetical protein